MPTAGLVTPSLETVLSSIEAASSADAINVESNIQYLISLLKRRQVRNSRACAIATAHLLSLVVSKYQVTNITGLIERVQEVGQRLTSAQPKELAVGNIVRRVLGVIRDEAEEDREGEESLYSEVRDEDAQSATPEEKIQSSSPSTSNPLRHDTINSKDLPTNVQNTKDGQLVQPRSLVSSQSSIAAGTSQPLLKSMFNLLSHPASNASSPSATPGTQSPRASSSRPMGDLVDVSAAKDLRAEVVEAIDEIIEELNTADDQIAGYALDHIHSNEIVLTHTASVTVQKFLLRAAAKRKFTVIHAETFPNDHENVHATVTGSVKASSNNSGTDRFHKSLVAAGITVILIPDSAVFALMSRVNKVVLGTHAVLANGSLVAAAGSKSIAQAASMHKTPVIVLSAVYKLSPVYPFSVDTFIEFGDTTKIISNDETDLLHQAEVENPLYDYVPSQLIDLYITNLGGHAPSYLYRIVLDHYRPEDTEPPHQETT
ncbi:translation initiation factor eIF-2B subunit beta [Physcia stellaris]|nr:translation initiation factor eIF-2B subunit beta [Physcia stellaris]